MLDIRVLGLGCRKCAKTYAVLEQVIAQKGIQASLSKVEDIEQMTQYNCCFTPAVVVNGVVVFKGVVPSRSDVERILSDFF